MILSTMGVGRQRGSTCSSHYQPRHRLGPNRRVFPMMRTFVIALLMLIVPTMCNRNPNGERARSAATSGLRRKSSTKSEKLGFTTTLLSSQQDPSPRKLEQQDAHRRLIYGGRNTMEGRYPYFARLVGEAQCGGALIAPEVVITAAHCE